MVRPPAHRSALPAPLVPALAIVLALAWTGVAAAQQPPKPDDDHFYAPPASLADAKPGQILRSREVDITLRGMTLPYPAWQLLYRSNDSKMEPVAAATTVILPADPPPSGQLPVVSYQTAEDSLATHCAPSYTLRTGTERELPAILQPLLRGWAVVAPDYEGPESQYGAGWQAGRAVLDSLRAALRFEPAGLSRARSPLGLWGYSGGGLATAWAAELQPGYAPRLRIAAAAGGGVPPDIEAVARQIDGGPFAGFLFAVAQGLNRAYPEMDVPSVLNEEGLRLWEEIADKCVDEISRAGMFKRSEDLTTVPDAIELPRIQRVLRRNHLGRSTPALPTYIYHAIADELIPIRDVDELVAEYCDEGAAVQYHRDPASEHVTLVATGALAALDYLEQRFGGRPAPSNCPAGTAAHAEPDLEIGFAPRRMRAAGRGRGGELRVHLNKPADLEVAIVGVRRAAAGGPRRIGALRRPSLQPGRNAVRFRPRLGGRRLRPGRYRARAVATDPAGRRSSPAKARFRIAR